jgi:6-phosphogluconolactonase
VGFAPQPPYGGPLYVSDPNSNAIDVFVVNGKDGTFIPLKGSPFSVGGPAGTPAGLLTFGSYLYAGDTNGSIAAFNVGASGGLAAVPGSPFAAGSAPLHLVTTYIGSPSVPLLYAADSSGGGIWAFVIGS